jgi:L-gulono-1,4-lactone dehydrogenase
VSPTWTNHTGNQRGTPRAIVRPRSLAELSESVRRAERERTTVRAAGSGHSWSDVALTDGILVEPDGLRGVERADDGTLTAAARAKRLVRVLSGTPLRELNPALEAMGLALPNMGGYDAQTLAGVVSTSTHGSGLSWGPFPDLVRSLDLVVAHGEVVRVEPARGPTDPSAFARAHRDRRLVQDDDAFAAASCGLGSIGLAHSLVIEVRDRFWLNEVRTVSTWEAVRDRLTPEGVLGEGDHYEVFVNPYAGSDRRHRLLVTRRAECPRPDGVPPDRLRRHPLIELQASLPVTASMLRLAARYAPGLIASRFDHTLADMVDDGYADISYRVFNIGEANKLPAVSMELGVALDDGRHLEAVDRILAIAAERRAREGLVHTSPFSLRFVAPSAAWASMMHKRATMMIELILVDGTRGGTELLLGYEERLADLEVRPHWGQINALTPARVRALYPRWDAWLAARAALLGGGANVFDSPFGARIGIDG